jgi:hypothetical protein
MVLSDIERARLVARNLVEVLTSYEEELMALEREAPGVGPLRRAVGMAIAEACYVISDDSAHGEAWTPSRRQ